MSFPRIFVVVAGITSAVHVAAPAGAQDAAPSPGRPTVLVETDPATFVFSGYAAHVRVAPRGGGWTVGAGVYGMQIPRFVAEIPASNRDGGWNLDLRDAYGLFVDYHFAGAPRGPFAGVQIALQRWQLGRDGTNAVSEYGTMLAMGRFGTLWHPFDSGFYVEPWVGVGPSVKIYGSSTVGDRPYTPLPVLAFGAVHVGWSL